MGLRIHPGKSKVLRASTTNEEAIVLEGKALEEFDSFCYLGILNKKGGTEADIKARIGKAQNAFKALNNIWRSKDISIRTKCRLFNSNVKLVLMYGRETWSTTDTCSSEDQIDRHNQK